MVFHAIGVVSYHLVMFKNEESASRKNLNKLNILQGGVEPRFIPSLSAETKRQIEGSFKITNDTDLRELALQNDDQVTLEPSDQLYSEIVDSSMTSAKVQTSIDLLQKYLSTKQPVCVFANLGGENGMRLSRSAFAVLLKFSDSLPAFNSFVNEVDKIMSEKPDNMALNAKILSTIQELQTKESSHSYLNILKQWEQAAQMRKWTQQIRLTLSEKIKQEVETKYRLELSEADPDHPFTGEFTPEHCEQIEKRIAEKYDV